MSKYDRNVIARLEQVMTGSSDIGRCPRLCNHSTLLISPGNVSYIVPTLHTMFGITDEPGSFPHHPKFAAAAGTDSAHQEAVIVGKSLALIGWEMVTSDDLFGIAQKQWKECLQE